MVSYIRWERKSKGFKKEKKSTIFLYFKINFLVLKYEKNIRYLYFYFFSLQENLRKKPIPMENLFTTIFYTKNVMKWDKARMLLCQVFFVFKRKWLKIFNFYFSSFIFFLIFIFFYFFTMQTDLRQY